MPRDDDALPSLDTVPPPDGGDAYSAETVQRQIPPELLAAAKAQLVPRAPRMPTATAPRREAPDKPPSSSAIERLAADEDPADDEATVARPMGPDSMGAGDVPPSPATSSESPASRGGSRSHGVAASGSRALATEGRASRGAAARGPSSVLPAWRGLDLWTISMLALAVLGIVLIVAGLARRGIL